MKEKKRIGIALSGGGIRATIFHLGVLQWMAENNMLGDVAKISTVSGASLAIGLVYSHNSLKWPTDAEYLNDVLPSIRTVVLEKNIQARALARALLLPCNWARKITVLSKTMCKNWGLYGNISDLEKIPEWCVNCTTFENGKRFFFTQKIMGDYKTGFVNNPSISISDVAAASAGFPILIGPYKLKAGKYTWRPSKYASSDWHPPSEKYIHLWDGGVYDNLGMEPVYKLEDGGHLGEGLDFVVISNAAGSIEYMRREIVLTGKSLKRLLDITMDQVFSLRSRNILNHFERTGKGVFLDIGNTAEYILAKSEKKELRGEDLIHQCMSSAEAEEVLRYPTTLWKPTKSDFDLILRHGYEVAMCTFTCYQ